MIPRWVFQKSLSDASTEFEWNLYLIWLRSICDLAFNITVPSPYVLRLRPRSGAQQWGAREEYRLEPSELVLEYTDDYGNLCQRLIAPTGTFVV
jgi:hypothetical protein